MLLYSEDRSVEYEGDVTAEIQKIMKGRLKAYFNAELRNTEIVLQDETINPGW